MALQIPPTSPVIGQRLKAIDMTAYASAIRALRLIEGPGIKLSHGPEGTRVEAVAKPAPAPVSAALSLPRPWDALLRQVSDTAPAGITLVRRWASLGGVFLEVPLDYAPGCTDSYAPFPAEVSGEWFVVASISLSVGLDGYKSSSAAIAFYPVTEAGRADLAEAGRTMMDSYLLPLYIVKADPDSGHWSITADLRNTPSLVVYT